MSNTAIDWLAFGSGLSGVSTHRLRDFGWVLMNSEPPPWPLMTSQTFQACFGCLAGSVPIKVILSLPSAEVPHTGPQVGCTKLAPRPGCGILSTSTSAASFCVRESTTAILSLWLAAVRK